MENVLPLFKSHYSLGKSILTLEDSTEEPVSAPVSCIALCKNAGLSHLTLVEDSMSGFLQAYQNSKQHGLKLIFGLRMTICDDATEKNEESLKTNNKIIIFVKNSNGYKSLIKIFSKAARSGFYYEPRTDRTSLKDGWDEDGLLLVIPFYNSFIHRNLLENALCVPEFSFTEPLFFTEDNGIPFDDLILKAVNKITDNGKKNKTVMAKSIYYNRKEDFKAYLTFRCINKRATLDKPNIDHMTSDAFCMESWKEKNEKV